MRRKHVLVVDDDSDIRDALAEVLTDEGYAVHTASDGVDALEYLRGHPAPGVILLDFMMPRCDGAEFRLAQKRDPELAEIPVVLLTADARVQHKMALVEADRFLSKPVQLDKLLDAVAHYCGAGPTPV